MKCPLCGLEFNEDEAQRACCGCPISSKSCNLVKCPNCGYEVPAEPRWLKRLRENRRQKTEDS